MRESTRVIAGTEVTGLFWMRLGGGDLEGEEEEVLILAEIQLGFLQVEGERAEEVRLKLLTNEAEDMVGNNSGTACLYTPHHPTTI